MVKSIRSIGTNNCNWSVLNDRSIRRVASASHDNGYPMIRVYFRVSRFYFNGHPYLSGISSGMPHFDFPNGFTPWTRGIRSRKPV